MKNEISTNKIIGDIKKTIGNRKYCYNLPEHLSDYAGSIVGWLKATTPAKIDALVEHIEELQHQLDRSISAERVWEKTMMEVCGEDGPASVAAVIKQLAAENVALKGFGGTLFDMYKGLEMSGGGIHDEQSVVCQQAALDAAISAFEEIPTPATDSIYAQAEARGVEKFAAEQRGVADRLQKRNVAVAARSISFCLDSAAEAEEFAKQLREGL
ncbi:TPA: hypothetical protein ACTW6G_002918 [Raoultella ornithinolytica]